MNGWKLARFNELRRDLLDRGLWGRWCDELRRIVAPDRPASIIEIVADSNPDHWRAAREAAERPRPKADEVEQLTLDEARASA